MTDTITLHKDGTGEREIAISSIEVPDLWHVAQYLNSVSKGFDLTITNTKEYSEMVLECWHLAHAMKDHLQQQDNDLDAAFNEGMKAAENDAAVKEICDNA